MDIHQPFGLLNIHKVVWDGNVVTRQTEWFDYPIIWDPYWFYAGIVSYYISAVPAPEAYSFLQALFGDCDHFGCFGAQAPWSVIAVYGTGEWGYVAGIY